MVIRILPALDLSMEICRNESQVLDFKKILPTRPIRPLYTPVHRRTPRRVDEQLHPLLLAGRFELILELRAAIDLDGLDRERKLHFQMM